MATSSHGWGHDCEYSIESSITQDVPEQQRVAVVGKGRNGGTKRLPGAVVDTLDQVRTAARIWPVGGIDG